MDSELEHHVDERTDWLVARGWGREEARREAERRLGRREHWKGEVLDAQRGTWEGRMGEHLMSMIADTRIASRALRRSPGFSALAVLTLGLGLGASTAIFSVVRPILLDSLPYPNAHRLVVVDDRASDGSPLDVTFGTFLEIERRSRSFEALAVSRPWQPTLSSPEAPERLSGQRVSAGFLEVLGVRPALGRDFDPAAHRPGGPRVVILAEGVWRRRFGADSSLVGTSIRLNGEPYMVAGIMPTGFRNVLAPTAQVWTPLQYDPALPSFDGVEWGHHLRMTGRLRPGSDAADARAELARIAGSPLDGFTRPPWASMQGGPLVRELRATVVQGVRPLLLILVGATALILLIACANVASLLLARAGRRREELAIRAALGASKARIARAVATESVLLALAGGVLGIGIAQMATGGLLAMRPGELPRVDEVGVDGAAFLFAFLVATGVGAGVGLLPLLTLSARAPAPGTSARVTGHLRLRRALVVGEVAFAVMVLVGTGLLHRSVDRLFGRDPGFDRSGTLVMQIQTAFDEDEERRAFFTDALEAVRRVPGVTAAALTSQMPLSGEADIYGVNYEDPTLAPEDGDGAAFRYVVTPGYFEAMGIGLERGRTIEDRDVAGAPAVIVVSESLARRYFGERDPIGERLHVGRADLPPYRVVGIVADVKQTSLAASGEAAVYVPGGQWYFADGVMWLVVASRGGDPAGLSDALRRVLSSVDRGQPVVRVATLERLVTASEGRRRFALAIFQAFSTFALVLTTIGIYGVLAGGVAERVREIGIRSALGASRRSILGLVVGQGIAVAGAGLVIGVGGALATTRLMESLLYEVSGLDPLTYVAVVMILALVCLVASWTPARRAAGIDPARALQAGSG